MFKEKDRMTLVMTHAKNSQGDILPFALTLPLEKEIVLPEDIQSIEVFECHEGTIKKSIKLYNMYIGKKDTFVNVMHVYKKVNMNVSLYSVNGVKIDNDTEVVYRENADGSATIDGFVKSNDLVLETAEEMLEEIYELSDSFLDLIEISMKIRKPRKRVRQL